MKNIFYFIPVSCCIIFLCGCPPGHSSTKPFPMTIIVSDKIGNSKSGSLPEDIINMCTTLPKTKCNKSICYPDPVLKRISNDEIEMSLKSTIDAGFAGDKSNPKVIDRSILKHINSIQIGENFSNPNKSDIDYANSIKSYIEIEQKSIVFCFSKNYNDTAFCNRKVFSDLDSLKVAISNALCEQPSSHIVVVYNPPVPNSEFKLVKMSELQKENEASKNNSKEVAEVKEKLESYSASNPKDYRPLYELAKNSIFGREEHHVAFNFLTEAVEIAIENGEAYKLKTDIGNDLAKGKENDVWKLAKGHPHDWNPIMEALSSNDISKLKHHDD